MGSTDTQVYLDLNFECWFLSLIVWLMLTIYFQLTNTVCKWLGMIRASCFKQKLWKFVTYIILKVCHSCCMIVKLKGFCSTPSFWHTQKTWRPKMKVVTWLYWASSPDHMPRAYGWRWSTCWGGQFRSFFCTLTHFPSSCSLISGFCTLSPWSHCCHMM